MADDSGGPTIPGTDNWSEWTFEQALKAITNEGSDLHTPAKAKWFNAASSPSGPADSSYHAWDKYYFSVSINRDAINAWATAVDAINEMMPDVARGKRGSMDQQTLVRLAGAIDDFAGWSQAVGGGMDQWASRLDSDDSAFKGKAAFLIYWRLKVQGDGLDDTYEQLTSRHGKPIAVSVSDAANELANFNATMSSKWDLANTLNIRNWISGAVDFVINDVTSYVYSQGLVANTSNYKLKDKKRADAEQDILNSLRSFPQGDLMSVATWDSMGDKITSDVLAMLKDMLDTPAQTAIGTLAPKYVLATSSLIEITAPPPQTAPQPDTDDGGGDNKDDLPPPPDGGGDGNDKIDLPPPPDGGADGNNTDLPPPPDGGADGNNTDLPPPPDGGLGGGNNTDLSPPPDGGLGGGNNTDLSPPPDGGIGGGGPDGLDLPNGGGGSDGSDLPNGGADGLDLPNGGADGLNPPGGGGGPSGQNLLDGGGGDPANGGAGGILPGLVPPGGGTDANGSTSGENGIGPGADGAFDENGLGNDLLKPPPADGGDGFSTLPSDSGSSGTQLPPSGGSDGSVDLSTPPTSGSDADGGLGTGPGGFGSDPGKGFGSGLGLGGPNGGANLLSGLGGPGGLGGGLGGAPGNSGLTGLPSQLSGGSPGVNGAPGSSGDGSGVPFFPPMMGGGGAGGNGEKPQERERQTWLSEDEEIWGTRVGVRSGAIGRLDDEEDDIEEFPLVGPTRGQRRAETPRRPRPDAKRDPEREATSSEEASGSA